MFVSSVDLLHVTTKQIENSQGLIPLLHEFLVGSGENSKNEAAIIIDTVA
jgi:hypothetical protein